MAAITIRRLDDGIKARLRLRAARNGRSMEEEARNILKAGLAAERTAKPNLADSIRRHFAPGRGVEISLPARQAIRRPPKMAG